MKREQNQLEGYRGPEPKPGEEDERPSAPVDDDPAPNADVKEDEAPAKDEPEKEDEAPKRVAMSPSDERRLAMFDRFEQRREDDAEKPQEEQQEQQQEQPGEEAPPTFKLKVNHDTIEKSLDEVAKLADMTPEEVQADPARAIRYAQKELAADLRLEQARQVNREATTRAPREQEDTRPPAPDQERKTGQDDKGQQDDARDTSGDVDFKKLAEAIQVEDPEVAGNMLKDVIERSTRSVVSENESNKVVSRDADNAATAIQEFQKAHPTIADNKFVIRAMGAGLVDEYREDLIGALRAEGEADPEGLVATASDKDIVEGHRMRRLKRDPHVRQLDVKLFEKAYERVSTGLGLKPTTQDLSKEREERKENLHPQPRRASVPPARSAQQRQPSQEDDRKAGMELLRQQRGRPARG